MLIHRLGSYSWLLAPPLFLAANVITGLAWRQPRFSWADNNISDLGNVTCGVWDTTRPRQVCSPWHAAMNSAMIVTGLLLALGVLLTWSALGRGAATRAAQLLTLAGASGYVLAGAYPADVDENNHFLAALLIFVLGNGGMLVASLARRSPVLGAMREDSLALGLTGLAGTVLFLAQVDLGFGVGGMERVAVFPLLAWTVVVAVRLTRTSAGAGRLLC
ncbi:DUF998 domain-containing protein [Micromonospora sp. DR5-3]|uniref:DUF998 domain-containing protein n=1 Tax=unclassified Micromonospora TaxID=2617518 RepID=UPI0011D468CA|nr:MULTISPECIES: DUF998 domain-containing protein [unclassified Micromonospora]MCW3816351.1 DUF998 domain-containing protein [Micromonospora sp. DR5-3]TYC22771.1 DUF998 domain-containing protein [Micromonospora sp. MP36]